MILNGVEKRMDEKFLQTIGPIVERDFDFHKAWDFTHNEYSGWVPFFFSKSSWSRKRKTKGCKGGRMQDILRCQQPTSLTGQMLIRYSPY